MRLSAKEATARREGGKLYKAALLALRAWIKADAEDLSLTEHRRRLTEARRLTGYAVDAGLLKG